MEAAAATPGAAVDRTLAVAEVVTLAVAVISEAAAEATSEGVVDTPAVEATQVAAAMAAGITAKPGFRSKEEEREVFTALRFCD